MFLVEGQRPDNLGLNSFPRVSFQSGPTSEFANIAQSSTGNEGGLTFVKYRFRAPELDLSIRGGLRPTPKCLRFPFGDARDNCFGSFWCKVKRRLAMLALFG